MLAFPLTVVGYSTLRLALAVRRKRTLRGGAAPDPGAAAALAPGDRHPRAPRRRGGRSLDASADACLTRFLAAARGLRYLAPHEPPEHTATGRLIVGGCPEGFDARHLAATIGRGRRAGAARRARRCAAGGDAGVACASSRPSCRCSPSRPGTACPTTASRRTPRSRPRAWRRSRRSPAGFDRPAAVLTTVNAATQRGAAARRCWRGELHRRGRRARSTSAALRRYLRARGLPAGADGHRAGRVRGARRADRPLPAGRARAGAARPLRRRAGERAPLRPGDPAHHREGRRGSSSRRSRR